MASYKTFAAAVALLATSTLAWAVEPAAREIPGVPGESQPAAGRSKGAMVLTLLGTAGGPQARKDRSQPSNLLTVDGSAYLFDIGDGTVRQLAQAGMTTKDIRAAFVTHLHTDHVAGIPALLMFRWMYQMTGAPLSGLPLFGPPGTSEMTQGAVRFAMTPSETLRAQSPKAPQVSSAVVATDVQPGLVYSDDKIRVTAVANSHYDAVPIPNLGFGPSQSYSYRVDSTYGSVVFTGDTGPSAALNALAKGADVLVSEVIDIPAMAQFVAKASSLPPGAEKGIIAHMEREHLSPEEIGSMARAAGVGKVVLSHIANPDLTPAQTRALAIGVASRFDGPVVVGEDLMTMTVVPSTVRR